MALTLALAAGGLSLASDLNLTCKKSPPSIGGEMNCGFFCGFDALRKTIAL